MIKKIVFLGISLLFLTPSVSAQVTKDTLIAYQYYQKADSLLTDKKHEESIKLFAKALPVYEKAKAWERVASCYNKISENHWHNQAIDNTKYYSDKALKICNSHLEKNNKEVANAYINLIEYYMRKPDFGKALEIGLKTLRIRKEIFQNDHTDIAQVHDYLGIIYTKTAQHKKSLDHFKKALAINLKSFGPNNLKTGKNYNHIGIAYKVLGNFELALEYLKKDLAIILQNLGDKHLYAGYSYASIGVIYSYCNDIDKALYYAEKALSIFKEHKNLGTQSHVYTTIGTFLEKKGEFDKALSYHKKSEEINIALYGKNHPSTAGNYINIGVTYSMKKNNNIAIEYYNKALEISLAFFGENHDMTASLYANLGNAYSHKKEYTNALEYYKKSLAISNRIYSKNNPFITKLHLSIGEVLVNKKYYNSALSYYQKSLNSTQQNHGINSPTTTKAYILIADLFYKQEEYVKAISYYNKALQANIKNQELQKKSFNPDNFYNHIELLSTFKGKAKTLQQLYLQKNNVESLKQSTVIYENVDLLANSIRKTAQNYQDKIALATKVKEIYTNAISTQLLLFKEINNSETIKKAFYYTEKSKANTLKELLADSNAKSFSRLPKGLIKLEKTLKSNRAFYQSQIVKEQSKDSIDPEKIRELESDLFAVNRRQDSLTKIVEQNYPKYYQLKYKNEVVSVSEIQERLDNKTTVLEFFVADSTTYAFTISKNDIRVKELATPKLEENIEQFREAITSENATNYKKIGHTLYKELLTPIKSNIQGNNLIIIPDGVLWHLNFDLLLTKQEAEKNSRNLSYLLRDYAISYANSANLLFKSPKNISNSSEIRRECLAFSFSDSTNLNTNTTISLAALRDAGNDLPGTRQEIKAISEIIDGQYYYGSEAIEHNFKKHANNYSILHLALHGEVDHKNPQNSKLYFTKSKDTLEDNLLYSHELFALDIPAELTVLSACNTGTGKIANGEGVLSLGTAFQYAGTKSLLLSNWEVSDKTTPQLMQYFYANLKDGMNKAEALQQAKLQFLTTTEAFYTHPFYWGSFYVLGDTNPINIGNPYTIYYWIFGAFLIAFISFLFYKKRKSPL
ncbi:tetratricopeptide repeat protein [Aquimarina sp. 2201CG1-2-11]|uniref:tetratricopeptide repeat protein n=1 Tax=Aquimarina discodermiae TaxID=3231043 RepID=UPI003462EE17